MDKQTEDFIRSLTEGGVTADHPPLDVHAALVGPATAGERNTLMAAIIPIACWRLDDLRFEFDSSFILPEAREEIPELAKLRMDHPGAALGVFGHADPVGTDDYNKPLSGRRAQALYAVLVRDASLWEDLHSHPFGGDHWGVKTTQIMLDTVGHSPGPIDGIPGSQTSAAVQAFQKENGLAADGIAGPKTREKLFLAYMDALCVDGTGQPFVLGKTDFLAQGADAGGKGDYQGCGEFNPLIMFSQEENAHFEQAVDKTERNQENAPNRRVVVLLFRAGSRVTPGRWPCPRVTEGVGDCLKRFWSDAAVRRQFQAQRRHFEETQDTFACRFYQRITTGSPCESLQPLPLPPVPPVVPQPQPPAPKPTPPVTSPPTPTVPPPVFPGSGSPPIQPRPAIFLPRRPKVTTVVKAGFAVFTIVRDSDGMPLPGMTCLIERPDKTQQQFITDRNGKVRIAGKPGEVFTLIDVFEQGEALTVVSSRVTRKRS